MNLIFTMFPMFILKKYLILDKNVIFYFMYLYCFLKNEPFDVEIFYFCNKIRIILIKVD